MSKSNSQQIVLPCPQSGRLDKNKKFLVLQLSKLYDSFMDEKKNFLNHPKIIEYLFNKALINISSLTDLLINYNSDVKIVRLEKKDIQKIEFNFFGLIESLKLYSDKYDQKKLPQRIQINYLPKLIDLDRNQVKIMRILDKLENKKIISYVYKWSFIQEGSHLSTLKAATVNFENETIYDFFGVYIHRSKMDLFVIQFDDDSHFNSKSKSFVETHINDIQMQYILFQMNIHLLRINAKSNFSKEICDFLKKIKKSTEYVSINSIKPLKRIFNNSVPANDLIQFSQDFNYNRNNIYFKLRFRKNEMYDSKDDNYINSLVNEYNTNDKIIPKEESIIVSNEFVNKIIKEKESAYGKSLDRAEKIIVELIGHKYEEKISIKDILKSINPNDINDKIEVDEKEIYDLVFSKTEPKSNKAIITKGFNIDKFLKNYKPKKS